MQHQIKEFSPEALPAVKNHQISYENSAGSLNVFLSIYFGKLLVC